MEESLNFVRSVANGVKTYPAVFAIVEAFLEHSPKKISSYNGS
jgi:hypothetical protein